MKAGLPLGFTLGVIVSIITMVAVKPRSHEMANLPITTTLVECKHSAQEITDEVGCIGALRRYLYDNPTHRIVGVVAIDRNAKTGQLAVFWNLTRGHRAGDVVVEQVCDRYTGGCPSKLRTANAGVFTWVAVNDQDGTQAILTLRGTWDEGREMVDTGSP